MISGRKLEVRECSFMLEVTEGIASVRFPCSFFFELKTANGKHHVASNNRVKANNGVIAFQETVVLNVLMVYDLKQGRYKKKEAALLVSLLSNSRPNDPKLVGRVTLDLSQVANQTYPNSLANHALEYCSVNGQITFKISMSGHKATTMEVGELDRSELIQGELFGSSNLKASKEEHQSQVLSTSSIRSHGRDTAKLGESSLQERLARIKAEKLDLDKIPKPSVRWKKEQEESRPESHRTEHVENGAPEIKVLAGDFSLPVLSKNCSDFNSMKNSQATMKHQISEKVVKISEIPLKEQIKIKTDKYIDHSDHYQSDQKGLSCRDVEQTKIQHEKRQLKRQSISALDYEENKALKLKLQQANARQAELSQLIRERQQEIQQLKQSSKQRENYLNTLKQQSELYNQNKRYFQQTAQQNQLIKREMSDLQASLSNLHIQHQQILDLSVIKDKRIAQLVEEVKAATHSEVNQTKQNQIQQLRHQVQTEQKKHHNTQIELEQIREWFAQLQQRYENLERQCSNLTHQRNNIRFQLQVLQSKQPSSTETSNKLPQSNQITDLKNILEEKEKEIMMLMQELTHISDELAHKESDNQQIEKQLEIIKKQLELNHIIEKELREKIQQLSHECEVKQLSLLEKQEDIQQEREKVKKIQQIIREKEEQGTLQMRQAGSVAEDSKRRLDDLVQRMREKEQAIARLQRQIERFQQGQKQYEYQISKYKQKIKTNQQQRLQYIQKQNALENDLKQLTLKLQRQQDLNSQQISRYKSTLEQEATKRRELQRQICQSELNNKDQNNKLVSELQGKIAQHLDKEQFLKDSMHILENEINRIGDVLLEKQEREEHFNQIIAGLRQQQEELNLKISDYQNQLNFMRQRCEALQAEVELLNAYPPEGQDQNELMEINKKVTEQNKGLLSQIEEKNKIIGQLEKGIGETRLNASQQQLSKSRFSKEKCQLQHKLAYLTEENEKLYKEFDRVNLKYEEELEAMERINGDRITQLVRQIEQLSIKLLEKQAKAVEARQTCQMMEDALFNRQCEKDRYLVQIRQLIEEKESVKTKLVVLNQQYESIYSELGQKEYQLYEATGKLKDLQDKIAGEMIKEQAKTNKDQIQAETSSKIQQYLSQIQKLKFIVQQKHRETQDLRNNLETIKLDSERELTNKLSTIKSQMESDFQAKLDNLNAYSQSLEADSFKKDKEIQQILVKLDNLQLKNSQLLAKNEKFQQQISSLQKQRSTLKDEIDYLSSRQIGRNTPIHQFEQSPLSSVCKIQRIDLNYTVEQITNIIARRKDQEEVQSVLRLVIENNARYEDDSERWSREKGAIQQRAKMASRQIQKMKSQIMKTPNRSISQKSQMTGLLRPVQKVIDELINLSEKLTEWQLDRQDQQEAQKENV